MTDEMRVCSSCGMFFAQTSNAHCSACEYSSNKMREAITQHIKTYENVFNIGFVRTDDVIFVDFENGGREELTDDDIVESTSIEKNISSDMEIGRLQPLPTESFAPLVLDFVDDETDVGVGQIHQ
jgi:hypothetical protein